MEIFANVVLVLLIIDAIVMTVAIVALPPKGQGIGGAIGGETDVFGRKKSYGKTAMLEKVVDYSAFIFMVAAFVYNVLLKFI